MQTYEIILKVSEKTGFKPADVKEAFYACLEEIKEANKSGDDVFIRGFGTFKVHLRAQKKVRNITKGETMIDPAHFIPKFMPAPLFKKMVKDNNEVKDNG